MMFSRNHALNILHLKDASKRVQSVPLPLQIYKEFSQLNQALPYSQLYIGGSLEQAIDLLLETGQY